MFLLSDKNSRAISIIYGHSSHLCSDGDLGGLEEGWVGTVAS